MSSFIANPNRDASDTIAGFVYQVDVTLLRWLNLQADEVLELERGEDIDTIQKWLDGGDLRTLEQVKRRSSPVTLRSPDALASIANFSEHKTNNPTSRLRFRFLTTGKTGKEKKWPLSGTGIEAWEALRQGRVNDKDRATIAHEIRSFLKDCPRPEKLSLSAWQSLQALLAGEDEIKLIELIESFEWSTGARDDSTPQGQIKKALIESHYAADESGAQAILERLFLYVFRKLSQSGPKSLTSAELSEQLLQPPVSGGDRQLFTVLALVREQGKRLDLLEDKFLQEQGLVAALGVQIAQLKDEQGKSIRIEYRDPIPNLDCPEIVHPSAARKETVDHAIANLEQTGWIHIVGEPGIGKTQLALLVSQRLGSTTFWINLRDCTEDQACAILDLSIGAASGVERKILIREWYSQAASRIAGTAIVIDDLPRMFISGRLAQRLDFLRSACKANGIRLLSASYYHFPNALVSSGNVFELNAPRLENREILEFLRINGAPESHLTEGFADFLHTLTQGLPILMTAVARFLVTHDWKVEWSSLQSILQGEFAKAIRQDAEGVIQATVPDADTRELLYRLRLVLGDFSKSEVEAVALIPKRVDLAIEKLQRLTGLWVQEYKLGRYRISALLDSSISTYLNSKTKRGVHAVLALRVLSKKKIDPSAVFSAFYHFDAADLPQQAVILLLQALWRFWESKDAVDEWGISNIWSDRPLPSSVDINLRLFLRALQIAAFDRRGREMSFLRDDFERLVQESKGEQRWGAFMAASFLTIHFAFTKPIWANRYLLIALRNSAGNKIVLPDGNRMDIPDNAQLETALWVTAHKSSTDEDVEDWLATVSQLTSDHLERLRESDIARDNAVILCESIWLREYRKPEAERDWDRVTRLLKAVETTGIKVGFPLLSAAAIRTQIVILAEWEKKIDEAVRRAEKALTESTTDDERFLLLEVTGRQLTYADRWEEGVKWLQDALALNATGFPIWERNVLITLSEGIGRLNANDATNYTKKAVEVAEKWILEPMQTAEALAEQSIALWFASDRAGALHALERGVDILMTREEAALWKKTFLLFLHVAGYFGAMAFSGSPPSASFAIPRRGMFLATDNIYEEAYKPVQRSLLFIRMAMFADGVGDMNAARVWTRRALQLSPNEVGLPTLVQSFSWLSVAPDLLANDWQAVLQTAELILQLPAIPKDTFNEIDIPDGTDRAEASEIGQTALRDRGINKAVFPLVVRLATLNLSGPITNELSEVSKLLSARTREKDDIWHEVSGLIEGVFSSDPDWKSLYEHVAKYYGEGRIGLGMIAMVGCILYPPVKQSLAFQVSFAQTLAKLFPKRSSIWREIVEPLFLAYWRRAALAGEVVFRTSQSYVNRRLDEVSGGNHGSRLRRLLREMVFCVGLNVPDADRSWLETDDSLNVDA